MNAIRPARADDVPAMAALHATAFADGWDAEVLRAFLTAPGAFGLIAEDEHVAGFVLCRAIAGEAEILTLAVAPSRRREGVGARLLAAAAREAVNGAEALFLEVADDNDAALALYRGAGFAEVGRRRAYYSSPTGAIDALILRRDLNR